METSIGKPFGWESNPVLSDQSDGTLYLDMLTNTPPRTDR